MHPAKPATSSANGFPRYEPTSLGLVQCTENFEHELVCGIVNHLVNGRLRSSLEWSCTVLRRRAAIPGESGDRVDLGFDPCYDQSAVQHMFPDHDRNNGFALPHIG